MPAKLRRKIAPFFSKIGEFKILFVIGACIVLAIFLLPPVLSFIQKTIAFPRFVTSVVFNKNIELKKEEKGTTNVLLLGIGGGNHEGPNLSDTIIFAHIDPIKNTVLLVSIPRDLWVPTLSAKINSAYADGEEKKKGGGLLLAKAAVSDILAQPIEYGFRIDFSGFTKIVDLLGGLDITVDESFDDYEYPIEGKENDLCGKTQDETKELLATVSAALVDLPLSEIFPCRVEHIHFDKGKTHMDGTTALTYVRSRHAIGEEGSDFARSRRQQKVINGVRDKAFSLGVLLNPIKISQLWSTVQNSIDTDIATDEFDDFVKLAEKMKGATIKSTVIDQGDEEKKITGLLIHPPITSEYRNAWVLAPRIGNGNFSEIQKYVACEIATDSASLKDTCLP